MVEHTSAQTTQHQHQQSFNGGQAQRWHHRRRRRDLSHEPDATGNGAPTSPSHRFSLFRWFKRRKSVSATDNRRRQLFRRSKRRPSISSDSSSVDTFYSTATVKSFAFHSGRIRRDVGDPVITLEQSSGAVGPFAPGAVKLVEKRGCGNDEPRRLDATTTCTLPSAFSQRQDIETRYSLHPAGNPFISYDSIPIVDRRHRTFAEVRRNHNNDKDVTGATNSLTSNSSLSSARRVHVKGKRRAPDPPAQRVVDVHAAEGGSGSRPASRGRRKRRPAPQPPGRSETLSSNQDTLSSATSTGMDSLVIAKDSQTISNDTLVLRRGVLLSKKDASDSKTRAAASLGDSDSGALVSNHAGSSSENNTKSSTIMPRPWYKRNVFNEHSSGSSRESSGTARRAGGDILRGISTPIVAETKDEIVSSTSTSSTMSSSFPFEGSLSRLGFFHRGDRHHHDEKKKENKRKSGVSILTNISELDKEAAAIVQEEQARNRASMILQAAKLDEDFERRMGVNEEIVQEIVNSSMESSPRRSTRALINKFNALGNITKVTVNSSIFAKNNSSSPKAKAKRYSQQYINNRRDNSADAKFERDLSKYFLPHQPSPPKRESASIFTEIIHPPKSNGAAVHNVQKVVAATSPKAEVNKDLEFAKSLAAELDDVASGIARLRRELDERPKTIENAAAKSDQENTKIQTKESQVITNNLSEARNKELAKFDKEFEKIFDEIDRQLRTRDSRVITKPKSDVKTSDKSISNKVAKVIDILVGAEKEAIAAKNDLQSSKEIKTTNSLEEINNKEGRRSAVRISGVDDKTTAELKEMLKEMKHSLPKRPKPNKSLEAEKKPEEHKNGASKMTDKKPSPGSHRLTEEAAILPKVPTKVSSGVQTSGNVRRIVNEVVPTVASQCKEKKNFPETSSKNELPESSHRLINVNESPVIDAVERSKARLENVYANVIERSLYANAQVVPQPAEKATKKEEQEATWRVKIDLREDDSKVTTSLILPHVERSASLEGEKSSGNKEGEKLEEIKKQYMNTLAVNRLLRKLEAAIASGHHQRAAILAKELAQLKIHCSVVRQRSFSTKEKLNLNMYIEDKQAHQGPIPLQLPVNATVAQLKAKIHIEFEIPANIQRWIIGKNLADNDESTLEELQAVEGSPVFLYIVAPPNSPEKDAIKTDKRDKIEEEEKKDEEIIKPVINELNDEKIYDIRKDIEMKKRMEIKSEVEPIAKKTTDAKIHNKDKEESLTNEEKLKRYEELMSLENCDVISNSEPIECPVCFMIVVSGEGVILRDCLHSFCRLCVASTVRYCEEAEVKCPYRDADYTCESTLQEREIKALVAPEVYQQHLAKSIAQAENNAGNNAFHCKTPDCPGWCIYDDNVNNFLCPVCKTNNCLTCQAIHMGKNCRQYQEELKYSKETDHESKRTAAMLEEMVDKGEALPCPTCAVILMKKWGCDWLRCSMCKTEICWVTRGPRWGPGGKGDTSGGCRCGENGVKCHPKCNYCH